MAAGIAAAVVIAVVIGLLADDKPGEPAVSDADAAQQRCETDIVNRLPSPSTAQISGIEVTSDVLDADSRDLFSLLDPPLKGADHSRIKVWNVAGVVDSQNDSGNAMQSPFTCRAYFLDGELAHTLVLLDHHH
ncbi:hypothetical protein [Mycobacterium neglectum]|uniref:hypothetical protein n=1 Tax=Mycobacterium neglectum TaxID=242737 RepID=UPI000BFEDB4A|nr:hypothetical protein [Mycobacterium neglectum]